MAGSILDRIKRGLGLAGAVAGAVGNSGALPMSRISAHFRDLAKQDKALPGAIARFVADGTNSSVLSTLQQQATRQVWTQSPRSWTRRDEEKLFSNLSGWRIDQMQRFGEILAALEPLTYDWGLFGTKKSPDWLRHVVTLWLGQDRKNQPIATLLDLAGQTGDANAPALDIVFCRDAAHYGSNNSAGRFAGVAGWLESSRDAIAVAAPGLGADTRAELASAIGRLGLQQVYLELLLDMATGTSKKVRSSARQSLTACNPAQLAAALEERFAKASPNQRVELVEIASGCLGEAGHPLLERWRQGETAAKVIAALDRLEGAYGNAHASAASDAQASARPDGPEGYWAVDGSWVEAGPVAPIPPPQPVPAALLATLEPAMAEFNRMLAKGKAEAGRERWHWSRQFSTKDSRDLKQLAQLAEGSKPLVQSSFNTVVDWLRWHQFKHPAVDAFFHDPRLSLRHLVRLAVAMSNCHINGLFSDWGGPVGAAVQRRLAEGADPRAFITLWTQAGGSDFIAEHLTRRWYWQLPEFDGPLWPELCSRFDQIDQALGMSPQSETEHKQTLPGLELLEYFPLLPARYRNRLMLLAGDSSARIREKARALLQQTPVIDGAIAVQLQDGRQEVRALAADWLASRQADAEAPQIRAALAKEKSDLARAAMISALERMGQDVSAYFNPALLAKEAQAGLAKARPKGLDWFPFDMLPALRWADGTSVEPVLPQWWIVLSAKLKQPGGNALVNLWLDRLAPGDAHKLGWMVLTGWIDEDTRRPSDEDANAFAAQHVDATLKQNLTYAKRWPESADFYPTDRAVVFARLKQVKAGEYLGSAVDSKGVLALAARVNGADAAQRIRPFLKDHGARISQAKALLEVLASIGTSAALQLLLSAANRSKQRTVQAHAAALVEDIAERNGWSAAQLADRTVPTGGFDTDGTQELDLGAGRIYRLQFDAQDSVVILNPDGREVTALPAARVDEEKPLVDTARKQLSNARKEVKQVLAAQIGRLQEAMFLQRGWQVSEWESFVAGHPIVGRIASRLVWQGIDENGHALAAFRPLGDGSNSDCDDADVALADFAQIRLAHSSLMSGEDIARWRKHLADYAVEPPFDQLGRELPVLSEALRRSRTITDREGWMIETFKLRGLAAKLGYQRGQAQDGGWFLTYEKTFREAGLMAEIEFSGSPLPEENRQAALQSLSFRRLRANGSGGQIPLAEVPPVLLAESWRDLHDIADKGTGFDPDWKKKVY